jgi:hypothetical protein
MKRDLAIMLADIDQWPYPAHGIDLLQLFSVLRSHEEKVKVHDCSPTDCRYHLPTILISFWARMYEDMAVHVRPITELRLLSRLNTRPSCAEEKYERALRIRVLFPELPVQDSTTRAESSARWFVKATNLLHIHDFSIECHCGDAYVHD